MPNGSPSCHEACAGRGARRTRAHGRFFSLEAVSAKQGASTYICVVSRKVAHKAVARNRIKRWCREAVRAHMEPSEIATTLIFRAKKEAAQATFTDVKDDVRALVGKYVAAVYNNSQ